jgi:uncharacterized protein (TIGR02300 family)
MQDKSKLGTRYTCYTCGKKFYDLNKPDPVCPSCGANQFDDPTPDPRVAVMERYKGSRMTAADAAPSKEAFSVEETAEEDTSGDSAEPIDVEGDDDLIADENAEAPTPEPEG